MIQFKRTLAPVFGWFHFRVNPSAGGTELWTRVHQWWFCFTRKFLWTEWKSEVQMSVLRDCGSVFDTFWKTVSNFERLDLRAQKELEGFVKFFGKFWHYTFSLYFLWVPCQRRQPNFQREQHSEKDGFRNFRNPSNLLFIDITHRKRTDHLTYCFRNHPRYTFV